MWQDILRLSGQIAAILIFSRACSFILKSAGQPRVVGEMIAGILLGKSVLGLIWPEAFALLFPENSMPRLFFVAEIGLLFFMFMVGSHLQISQLRNRAPAAFWIANVSIALPFLLGVLLTFGIHKQHGPSQFSFWSFALFMGIAMSITAFPVLARILQEKQMTTTPLGTMALTCAAMGDITVWCLLVLILGVIKANSLLLFAAFFAGAVYSGFYSHPKLLRRLEQFSALVLLPVFFAYTGIRMNIGFLNSGSGWWVCGAVILVAIAGKMIGTAAAARVSGMKWRESWALGALMNTRGLMELVVLNIGYDIGILSPAMFAMLTIMAIVTTAMTGPLLSIFAGK